MRAGHVREKAWSDYKPVSVPLRAAVIPLGQPLLTGSCNLPESRNGAGRSSSPIWSCSAWGLPCRTNCFARGALLPHHFTLTANRVEARSTAVYFLWHFP
jgi:hypothetical protein